MFSSGRVAGARERIRTPTSAAADQTSRIFSDFGDTREMIDSVSFASTRACRPRSESFIASFSSGPEPARWCGHPNFSYEAAAKLKI